jgi:alkylhydroperoxidase family enzyme
MGSLATVPTEAVLAQVLAGDTFGDVHERLAVAHAAAWSATPVRSLELCRLRIAMLLGCAEELRARTPLAGVDDAIMAALPAWPHDDRFDATDRACLAFAEQWVLDVASLDAATAAAVREQLGDDGLQSFAYALLVVEQRIRLRLVWDRLFGQG